MIHHVWKHLIALDDHWIGDLLGGLSLAALLVMGLFAVAVFQ